MKKYGPFGVAFAKQLLLRSGATPVHYVARNARHRGVGIGPRTVQQASRNKSKEQCSDQGRLLLGVSIECCPDWLAAVVEERCTEPQLAGCTDVVPMAVFRVRLGNLGLFGICNLQIPHCLGLSWFESMSGSH